MDEKIYLKILKKQKEDLENIFNENKKFINNINKDIEISENFLLNLGYNIPIRTAQVSKIEKTKVLLRTWESIETEVNQSTNKNVTFSDLLTNEEINSAYSKIECLRNEYEDISKVTCDKYDYFIAGGCGLITGLIDIFFIGSPKEGLLTKWTDKKTEDIVKEIAKKCGWDNKKAENRGSDTTKSAIHYLEKMFKVNYDQQHGKLVNDTFKMSSINHHLKSLAHSPSPIGLIFSIINQFTSTSTFVNNGKLTTIDTNKFELQGNDVVEKLYYGFINWIMHIVSDMSGSSGAKGRGSGVPIPFYELFQFLNFGEIGQHQKTFADISVLVFEDGYDLRHGVAMSIPVLLNELLVRFLWALKLYYYENKSLKEIIKLRKSRNLKRILFTAHGCFCLVDLGDAIIRTHANPEPVTRIVNMLTRMNLVAWTRFGKLGVDELQVLLSKENEKHKFVNERLNEEWRKLTKDIEENYEFV